MCANMHAKIHTHHFHLKIMQPQPTSRALSLLFLFCFLSHALSSFSTNPPTPPPRILSLSPSFLPPQPLPFRPSLFLFLKFPPISRELFPSLLLSHFLVLWLSCPISLSFLLSLARSLVCSLCLCEQSFSKPVRLSLSCALSLSRSRSLSPLTPEETKTILSYPALPISSCMFVPGT